MTFLALSECQFGTESPETYADVLTITHSSKRASKPGQTVSTGQIYLFCYNQPGAIEPEDRILKPSVHTAMTISIMEKLS